MACMLQCIGVGLGCLGQVAEPRALTQQTCATAASVLRVPSERYEIIHGIQEGSTAHVYLARDKLTSELVALKKISNANAAVDAKLAAEFRVQQAVHQHQNVATAYTHVFDAMSGEASLAMEYCPGGDLLDKVVPDAGMDSTLAARYGIQVADALAHMHEGGYVHRDIKSENVCLSGPDGSICKIVDFGMAQHISQPITCRIAGTTPYVSPELLSPLVPTAGIDLKKADVWSLGIMFFSLLTGRFAWKKASTSESAEYRQYLARRFGPAQATVWARIPDVWQELLAGMLCVSPSERLTMQEVRERLREIIAHEIFAEFMTASNNSCSNNIGNGSSDDTVVVSDDGATASNSADSASDKPAPAA